MNKPFLERVLEGGLFASRWLMAPFYVGLIAALGALMVVFFQELWHEIPLLWTMDPVTHAYAMDAEGAILLALSLIDLSLAANLVLIVIFSGYENFVSKIDHSRHRDWPEWMGTIDFTALKIKLLGSFVAISAIQLLKQFMTISTVSDRDLFWLVIIHVVFVVSSVLLALSDRISASTHAAEPATPAPPSDRVAAKKHA